MRSTLRPAAMLIAGLLGLAVGAAAAPGAGTAPGAGATPAAGATSAADPLRAGFANPPNAARPRVWWHWMNGNITKEGIKLDLEWMQRTGIGGFRTSTRRSARRRWWRSAWCS